MNFGNLIPWRDKTPAPAPREDFFDPLTNFRREVDRMFDDFFTGFAGRSQAQANDGWGGIVPAVDIAETDKALKVTAELPGLTEKDFEVTVTGDVLTIKGEKKLEREQNNGGGYYAERRFGAFSRSVRLPFEVKDEKLEATCDKGVLTITIPKPAEIQKAVRRIEVKAA